MKSKCGKNEKKKKKKKKKKRAHEVRDTKKLLLHFDIIYDLLLYTDPRQHAIHSLYIKKTKFCLIASHLRVCPRWIIGKNLSKFAFNSAYRIKTFSACT